MAYPSVLVHLACGQDFRGAESRVRTSEGGVAMLRAEPGLTVWQKLSISYLEAEFLLNRRSGTVKKGTVAGAFESCRIGALAAAAVSARRPDRCPGS
jgi:hypothetical protein